MRDDLMRKAAERVWLSAAVGLFFGGIEVEEGFVKISFSLPVADYIFDVVLLVGDAGLCCHCFPGNVHNRKVCHVVR